MVATGLLLVQLPPSGVLERPVADPAQTVYVPVIGEGNEFTVNCTPAEQPVGIV